MSKELEIKKNKLLNPEWIYCKDMSPQYGQKCWVVNCDNDLFLATYEFKYNFFGKKIDYYKNLLGRRWSVFKPVKWCPLIMPNY